VLLIISGVEAGGRGETANQLTAWMDPRHIRVQAFGPRTPEEAARPAAWRYWRGLPAKGKVGIFMNAWYREMLAARLRGAIDDGELHARMAAIRHHERMLTDEGIVLLVLDPPVEGRPEAAAAPLNGITHQLARDAEDWNRSRSTPVRTTCGNTRRETSTGEAVVRRRGHRRALSQPVRRKDPAERCSGPSPRRSIRRRDTR
jgi:hypothetical protein